ncbi:MAG: hypothetical protein CVT66_06310 [Actinobacteria bacterium HGW-Actinobacteria-6]|nr:MAG: hypothetical protein CVT66_06310 [Actinobacteria bacterium HGW-Actinobacteria-6]
MADYALAVAAVLTAAASLTGAVFAWVKWQREIRAVRAELSPSDPAEQLPTRAIPDGTPPNPGTTRDVVDSSHLLLLQIAQQVEGLIVKDGEIKKWGEEEHARLDVRIDGLTEDTDYRITALDERVTNLEKETER